MKNSARWHYLDNQFENGTNYKSMNTLSSDHLSRLKSHQGEPFFDELITYFAPFRDNFSDAYAEWCSVKGIYSGHTLMVQRLFLELKNEKLPSWSGKIMSFYHKNTPQYNALFFQGLKVFNRSDYENRISSVSALAGALCEARKKIASAMYRNLGMLMAYYHEDPSVVEIFFETKHLVRRRGKKDEVLDEVMPVNEDGTPVEL
jgi:hypothetical protein